ncbi:MAG: right-handed parallel beta-helix repeat-containing protein [Bacteroidota bacterium]
MVLVKLFMTILLLGAQQIWCTAIESFPESTNSLVVSPIGRQQVIAGGKIDICFSAFDSDPSGVAFHSADLPPFAEIINNGDNTGKCTVNSSPGDEGAYVFHLQVTGTTGSSEVAVHLEVLERDPGSNVYYCDPVNGHLNNPGDSLNPWGSLEELLATDPAFEAGDIIFLRDGYHGFPHIKGENSGIVTITAQANHKPKVKKLSFHGASNWTVSGLEISPESAGITELGTYLELYADSKHNTIENCHIYGIRNSDVWTDNQAWYDNCGNGILNRGKYNTLRNNLITNTYHAVTIEGDNNHFDYNHIDRYGGDGIRSLSSFNTFYYNVITNAVVSDYDTGNHDDAFQSWTFSSSRKSVHLKGNIVISCTDPDLPLKTSVLQGIAVFDGFVEDWVIENNLVAIDHPHGISLYGAKNCKIVNNTVLRNPLQLYYYGSQPWIMVNNHKDGRVSTGNLIRNNLSGAMVLESVPGTDDHNLVSQAYSSYLNGYTNWDFHLGEVSLAIDAGVNEDAPTTDLEGYVKLPGSRPDLGCFEREADIIDFEKPGAPSGLQVLESSVSGISLSWDAASDNTGVSCYRICYDNLEEQTTDTEISLNGLSRDSDYEILIEAIDLSGNVSEIASVTASTLPHPADSTYHLKIDADRHDHQIRSNYKLEWVGLHEHRVGGVSSSFNSSAVIPFELPHLAETEEIKSAELILQLKGIENTPQFSVDLYGLPARSQSDVLSSDHWQGIFGDSGKGTGLVSQFITAASIPGLIPISSVNSEDIAGYLNGQYEEGATEGDYIFFRLNSGGETEAAGKYYRLSSANELRSKDRPYLDLTIGLKETSLDQPFVSVHGLHLYPNPVDRGRSFIVEIPESLIPASSLLMVHDIMGRLVYRELIHQSSGRIEIGPGAFEQSPGTYLVSIQTTTCVVQEKLIIR